MPRVADIASRARFLTYASLLLLPAWGAAGGIPPGPARWSTLGQLIAGTAVLAAALWLLQRVRRGGGAGRVLASVLESVVVLTLGVDLLYWAGRTTLSGRLLDQLRVVPHWRVLLWLLALAGVALFEGRNGARRAVLAFAASVFWPLPLVLLANGALAATRAADPPTLSRAAVPARRVIWIIFDELDLGYLDADSARLPGFDALRRRSFWASQAASPANETRRSVPMLLTGMQLASVEPTSGAWLAAQVAPGEPYDPDLLRERGVITAVAAHGFATRVIGWAFRYCGNVTHVPGVACSDDRLYRLPGAALPLPEWLLSGDNLLALHHEIVARRIGRDPRSWYEWDHYHGPESRPELRMGDYVRQVIDSASTIFGDPTRAFVFAHLPCPHLPPFDLIHGVPAGTPQQDYAGNLRRCDELLRAVLRLVDADSRHRTLLVTSSDHWFRYENAAQAGDRAAYGRIARPIPFSVYQPAWSAGGTYVRPFSTLRTRELVERYLAGSIGSYADVARLVDTWPAPPAHPAD